MFLKLKCKLVPLRKEIITMDEKEFEEQLSAMHDRVLSMALTEEEQNILLRSTKR